MYRGSFAIVDHQALTRNVKVIRSYLGSAKRLLISVKANGYGHGSLEVAKTVLSAGATDLGVASLEEALTLREAGITAPILIFGYTSPRAACVAAEYDVSVTVGDDWTKQDVPDFAKPLKVHLKYETGMNRLGFTSQETLFEMVRWLEGRNDVTWEGLFTHLACADGDQDDHSRRQIGRFEELLHELRRRNYAMPLLHASNSAGTLRNAEWHYDLVRVGIAAYGYAPSLEMDIPVNLEPALNLYGFVTRVSEIEAGETVGYGATFVARQKTRIATVPVGYADGYPRSLSNCGYAFIRGQKAKVIGNVCMDQLMLDITNINGVKLGDCVTLYGHYAPNTWHAEKFHELAETSRQTDWLREGFFDQGKQNPVLSLDELAFLGHTISYELMCALSPRIPRLHVR